MHSFACGADSHVVRHDAAHTKVLAVLTADLLSRSNYSGPYRSCGSLRNGLQLEGCFALGRKLLDHLLNVDGVHMANQLRPDASWMYRRSAYVIPSMTPVESNGEEDVGSLWTCHRQRGFIGRPHRVGVFKIDVGEAVPSRREVDWTPSFADK